MDSLWDAQEIIPGLYLGSEESGSVPLEVLKSRGIARVLVPAKTGVNAIIYPEDLIYLQYNIPDVGSFPLRPLLSEFFAFIDCGLAIPGQAVLVHCAAGKSRSAAVVIAYVMHRNSSWSFTDAYAFVKSKRPQISTKFEEQLQQQGGTMKRHPFTAKPLFSNEK